MMGLEMEREPRVLASEPRRDSWAWFAVEPRGAGRDVDHDCETGSMASSAGDRARSQVADDGSGAI